MDGLSLRCLYWWVAPNSGVQRVLGHHAGDDPVADEITMPTTYNSMRELEEFLASLPAVVVPHRGIDRLRYDDRWGFNLHLDLQDPRVWAVVRQMTSTMTNVYGGMFFPAIDWHSPIAADCIMWELSANLDASPGEMHDALEAFFCKMIAALKM